MSGWRSRAIESTYRHRQVLVIGVNLIVFAAAYWTAFGLRFDFDLPAAYWAVFWATLPVLLLLKTIVFSYFDLHQGLWRYVSISDLERILKAAAVSSLCYLAVAFLWATARPTPRSVILADMVLTVVFIGGIRFAVRVFREAYRPQRHTDQRRALIVGAGAAGEQALREIRSNARLQIKPVGLVDDDARKRGGSIHGVRILGTTDDLGALAERLEVEEILIAIPSATGQQLQRIIERCEAVQVHFKVLPASGDLIAGRVSVRQFREVQIEDLLGREHIHLDSTRIGEEIAGQTVLITGAGGSIGSELARQVLAFEPARLLLLDRSENGLFFIDRELGEKRTASVQIVPIVGDIQDRGLLEDVFNRWRPSLVYHAAAYKHVPLMETSVLEAVRNNVFGTRLMMDTARKYRADRFVLISTDKAVLPRNVMGATKRLAELIMLEQNGSGGTKCVAVRFGNVLGSDGSVLPIFRRQLLAGGPLTVTHPDATRYFMTIPEATQLVMQAGSMGTGGEIFLLDMGQPMKVIDLAKRLITLAGKKPYEDVAIVFTGLRPGEKLHEELSTPDEPIRATSHHKIMRLASLGASPALLQSALADLERDLAARDAERVLAVLMTVVATPGEAVRDTGS